MLMEMHHPVIPVQTEKTEDRFRRDTQVAGHVLVFHRDEGRFQMRQILLPEPKHFPVEPDRIGQGTEDRH